MASANTLCKKLLNVKGTVIESCEFYTDQDAVKHLRIHVRPDKRHDCDCPYCHRHCPGYDQPVKTPRLWRALDWNGILVEVSSYTHRVVCPDHGTVTAEVPWAFPGSSFTKDFDLTTAWLAVFLPRSTVREYMRIDWKTIGRCITRTLHIIEPERAKRLDGLVNIGIDETSYKKGHKYITVVVNHDTNTVVWAHEGHGKAVLEEFYRQLTPEQLSSIRVVTGDGARWITDCVNVFTPGCERCIDPFHVVQWAMNALDEVRKEIWRDAYAEVKKLKEDHTPHRGRPGKDDTRASVVAEAKAKAEQIKNSAFALGKAPEHLTNSQRLRLEMIATENPKLYRAYQIKERLRILLKSDSLEDAERELKSWLWWASHCRIPAMYALSQKIRRHAGHILNTIRLGMSNARIEAVNNKIKLIVRKAYGFRNIENMLDMVYLVCSDLSIPLPNRKCMAR